MIPNTVFYFKEYKEEIQSDTPDVFKLHATYIFLCQNKYLQQSYWCSQVFGYPELHLYILLDTNVIDSLMS